MVAGRARGLQNRCGAALQSRVGSTPTHSRHRRSPVLQELGWPGDASRVRGPVPRPGGGCRSRRSWAGQVMRRGFGLATLVRDRSKAAAARCRSWPGRAMWRLAVVPSGHSRGQSTGFARASGRRISAGSGWCPVAPAVFKTVVGLRRRVPGGFDPHALPPLLRRLPPRPDVRAAERDVDAQGPSVRCNERLAVDAQARTSRRLRPETRSPGWAASRTAAPTPARGANAPAPGCARCRTGRDAQAARVSAATSAYRRAGSDLAQTRPESRSPGWGSSTPAPPPAQRGECPRARMCALPNGTRRAGSPSVRCNERLSTRRLGPPADASRDTESRLGSLKNGRAYSC